MKDLTDRIKEIAVKVAPDYPNVEGCSTFEQLWAIESACLGTDAANKDCHMLIDHMRQQLGWTKEHMAEVFESVVEK